MAPAAYTLDKRIELAKLVIGDIFEGMSIGAALAKNHVTGRTLWDAVSEIPSIDAMYQRAMKYRAEKLADEIVEISDSDANPNKVRNQVIARQWAASKMNPKKFGDRIEVDINQTVDIRLALQEANSRLRQVMEIPAQTLLSPTDLESVNETNEETDPLSKLLE